MTVKPEPEIVLMKNERVQILAAINQSSQFDENFKPSLEYWKLVGQIEILQWILAEKKTEVKTDG